MQMARGSDGCHLLPWDSLDILIPLTAIALLYKIHCVLLYYGLEIAYPHDLSCEGLASM